MNKTFFFLFLPQTQGDRSSSALVQYARARQPAATPIAAMPVTLKKAQERTGRYNWQRSCKNATMREQGDIPAKALVRSCNKNNKKRTGSESGESNNVPEVNTSVPSVFILFDASRYASSALVRTCATARQLAARPS
jgi:hypothetical protein